MRWLRCLTDATIESNTMKRFILIACCVLASTGCDKTDSPDNVAYQYAVAQGKADRAADTFQQNTIGRRAANDLPSNAAAAVTSLENGYKAGYFK